MPYTAEVSRDNPTFFLFMVDQSRSMEDEIRAPEGTQQKSVGVADTINRWLQELSVKCAKVDGVRDYYSVGVIGYGKQVGPAFGGSLKGRDLVPISEIADNPARLDERNGAKVPVWFDPIANGGTPMNRAGGEALRILKDWLGSHPDCFPPIVIHVTDGEATDGNPTKRLTSLKELTSSDGNAMLFNIHLSANPNATPIIFPDSPDGLPDAYSKMLFETASPLTPTMHAIAKEFGIKTTEGSKAFVLNADMVLLVQAVDIGTRPANLVGPDVGSDNGGGALAGDSNEDSEGGLFAEAAAESGGADDNEMTVVLTVAETGDVVDTSVELDGSGRIVNVVPTEPLDPTTEYRLLSVPASSLEA